MTLSLPSVSNVKKYSFDFSTPTRVKNQLYLWRSHNQDKRAPMWYEGPNSSTLGSQRWRNPLCRDPRILQPTSLKCCKEIKIHSLIPKTNPVLIWGNVGDAFIHDFKGTAIQKKFCWVLPVELCDTVAAFTGRQIGSPEHFHVGGDDVSWMFGKASGCAPSNPQIAVG